MKIDENTYTALQKLNLDACDTDTTIREIIRPTGIDVDGDSYGVPALEDIVEELVSRYEAVSNGYV